MTVKQPEATDFTAVIASPTQDGQYYLRVKLDSRWVNVGDYPTRKEAEIAELAIHQAMIEYRTRRNEWNNQH